MLLSLVAVVELFWYFILVSQFADAKWLIEVINDLYSLQSLKSDYERRILAFLGFLSTKVKLPESNLKAKLDTDVPLPIHVVVLSQLN
jgi:hypothetical protein